MLEFRLAHVPTIKMEPAINTVIMRTTQVVLTALSSESWLVGCLLQCPVGLVGVSRVSALLFIIMESNEIVYIWAKYVLTTVGKLTSIVDSICLYLSCFKTSP